MSTLVTLLRNRFFLAFFVLVILIAVVNFYVSRHDDGILIGKVLDNQGAPVVKAKITLLKQALIGFEEIDSQYTDEEGTFRFSRHNQHHPALQVEADGYSKSDLRRVRLYFRNQNRQMQQPIILSQP